MSAKGGERSASSATRFTATTPHASSKMGSGAATPKARFQRQPTTGGPKKPISAPGPSVGTETPEQRVARLRAAHEAAKNSKISRFDQIIARARPFFDSAHRATVVGLVGLTAVAVLMTGYTAYDMMRHNRARKIEFLELQQKMAADSLEAARLAYMRNEATEEQMKLVDEANARAEGFKMPSILSAPQPLANKRSEDDAAPAAQQSEGDKKSSKFWGLWPSKTADGQDQAAAEQQPKTLEEKRALLENARLAFEKEKENQRNGGPLDRIGTEIEEAARPKDAEQPKKKGWFW